MDTEWGQSLVIFRFSTLFHFSSLGLTLVSDYVQGFKDLVLGWCCFLDGLFYLKRILAHEQLVIRGGARCTSLELDALVALCRLRGRCGINWSFLVWLLRLPLQELLVCSECLLIQKCVKIVLRIKPLLLDFIKFKTLCNCAFLRYKNRALSHWSRLELSKLVTLLLRIYLLEGLVLTFPERDRSLALIFGNWATISFMLIYFDEWGKVSEAHDFAQLMLSVEQG